MKNKLKIITLLLIILLIIPVNAETVNIDIISSIQSAEVKASRNPASAEGVSSAALFDLYFVNIEEWNNIKTVIYYIPYQLGSGTQWLVRDVSLHTTDTPIDYYIGARKIGSGQLQFILHTSPDDYIYGGVLTFTFDTPLDLGDSTGATLVTTDYTNTEINMDYKYCDVSIVIDSNPDNCPKLKMQGYWGTYYDTGIAYKYADFKHGIIYNYEDETKNSITLDVLKYDYNSYINLISSNDMTIISKLDKKDIHLDTLYSIPYILSIQNPIYDGSGLEYFNYTIPKEEEEEDDKSKITYTVYDGLDYPNIISSTYNLTQYSIIEEKYYPYKTGENSGTMQIIVDKNYDYRMNLTKSGYSSKDNYFTALNSEQTLSTKMYPEGYDNFTVLFQVVDTTKPIAIPISGAKITANEVIKYTNANGYTAFDVENNVSFDISKDGYVSISGYELITEDTILINILMTEEEVLGPTITTTLTYTVYDGANSSNIISSTYNLTKYSIIQDEYYPYKTGYNPGSMNINIDKNYQYRMNLTKTNYKSKNVFFTALNTEQLLSTKMYPEYFTNFTVLFQVVDTTKPTAIPISGAKITANGMDKYTNYNGYASFYDINESITYLISKTGYGSISGYDLITEDTFLINILMTEDEIIAIPTTTPITPPDLEQPTNILESIKYAFAQMFGLTESADLETMNLFMGLGIIFAGAVLIASITKDALGAVVGALIGFIMSLALGFIPLWVLFVGFAGFAIYIILTKTGGGE